MQLEVLRDLAFRGSLEGFVYQPPLPEEFLADLTGLHLKYDSWFARRMLELVPARAERRELCREIVLGGNQELLYDLMDWNARRAEMGWEEAIWPVVVVVDHDPRTGPSLLREVRNEFRGYPIQYRPSPAARGTAGMLRIRGGGSTGTLGGFLVDARRGERYAITCGHVGGSKGEEVWEVDRRGRPHGIVGPVVESILPVQGTNCNRHAAPETGVDAALIRARPEATLPEPGPLSLARIRDIDQEDEVLFEGSQSGRVLARVASATIWKTVTIDGMDHCFGDAFSLGSRKVQYFLESMSRPGDSGSWVLDDQSDNARRWVGIIVGGEKRHNQSIACYAEQVFAWAQDVNGDLALPP